MKKILTIVLSLLTVCNYSCSDDKKKSTMSDERIEMEEEGQLCLTSARIALDKDGQFALLSSSPEGANVWILAFIPALSRCGSALAVTILPPMSTSQYAKREKKPGHIWFLSLLALILVILGVLLCGRDAVALAGVILGYGLALRYGYKNLGGMNGDISGYSLTCAEFMGLLFWIIF